MFKKSIKVFVYICVLTLNFAFLSDIVYSENEDLNESEETMESFSMVNNDNDQARSVFSDTCGTVNLSASRSLVAVVVYQKKGWVLWQFKGEVTDSLGDDHSIYLYSTTGGSLSDSYELSTRGYRTLKLTGEARDLVSGHGCIVVDDAQITHTY